MSAAGVEVSLHPKTNYRLSLALIPASGLFLLMWLVAGFDPITTIAGVGVALVLVLGSFAVVFYLRVDRTLIVDARGVRLVLAGETVNDIPWENVARFRYGIVGAAPGFGSAPAAIFWVHPRNQYRGLSVVESYYDVPPGSLWNASLVAADLARARGIPVVRKDGLIRDFGP